MKVIIAQLSDIHLESDSDLVLEKAGSIGASIAAAATNRTVKIVVVFCGDISFSGQKEEFELASNFLDAINHSIKDTCKENELHTLVIPGNHDCNFAEDQTARNHLLQTIGDEPLKPSVKAIVLKPLDNYFEFLASKAAVVSGIGREKPFYDSYDIVDGNNTIRFHLLNTAWMSSLEEKQGTLNFPLSEIPDSQSAVSCSIALLHHPIHWQAQPNSMRPLRDKLESLSSLIAVNHEHTSEAFDKLPVATMERRPTTTTYVHGGVLQEANDEDTSTFNIISIDTNTNTGSFDRYAWVKADQNGHYKKLDENPIDLGRNLSLVGLSGFCLSEKMELQLEDPGVPIRHPNRGLGSPIKLSDIFIYPDLWELDEDHDGKQERQLRSHEVAKEILAKNKVLITGGEKSGRSSIAKALFRDAFASEKIPLLLKGSKLPTKEESVRRYIGKAVEEQYSNLTSDAYEQIERKSKVIVIDDAHELSDSVAKRKNALEYLERIAGIVVICGDDLIRLDSLKGHDARSTGLWEYNHYVIVGFGEFLREKFVANWLSLSESKHLEDDYLTKETERICGILNLVLKKDLLPAYPLFLLVVLQQADLATASVRGGSFGKLFEGVVTAILHRSEFTKITIEDKYNYLAALAWEMYSRESTSLPRESVESWHSSYWQDIELTMPPADLLADLDRLGIVSATDKVVEFRYSYFFCFFVAYQLHRNIHIEDTHATIGHLCENLHHRISADIVLFLAHLTGNPIVLNKMTETCENLFPEVEPATLDTDDASRLNTLARDIQKIEIRDSPQENRQEGKAKRDKDIKGRLAATEPRAEVSAPQPTSDTLKFIFDLNSAFKTIQILGQALRNVAGSTNKGQKEEILDRIVGLARRVIAVHLTLLEEESLNEQIQEIAQVHRSQDDNFDLQTFQADMYQHIYGLFQFICFSVIRHTSMSIGSQNLRATAERILGRQASPILGLLGISFQLESQGGIPTERAVALHAKLQDNNFSSSLVRILIARHLYMYNIPYQDKQTLTAKLHIELKPRVFDQSRKVIAKR